MKQKEVKYKIEGMSCVNCALGIEKELKKHQFINFNINFTTSEGIFKIENDYEKKQVQKIIKNLGYKILEKKEKKTISLEEKYFIFSAIFTIPLFSHMFVEENSILKNPLLQFLLCVPVYIIGLVYFGKSALNSLKNGLANMNVLIFIGSTASFIYSIVGWVIYYNSEQINKYLFFETTTTIITLVLLGNVLERRSVKKTTSAIKDLSKIQKGIAKIELGSKIKEISYNEIKINNILIINNGDKIPTDGKIISGECHVDESMITGESNPTFKKINDKVIGGTIVTDGNIKVKANKIGEDTLLSQIIKLVKDSQNSKPNIQKLGDKVSAVFVPVVVFISIITFFVNHLFFSVEIQESILRAIAVLVISCPCAMGLATPTAVMVGIGRATKKGILIKGGDTIEKVATIKNIAFDKTGTITTGNFIVSELKINKEKHDINDLKNIIYNIEKHSSHPIAKSLCKIFEKNSFDLQVSEIEEKKGISISAKINSEKYTVGSSKIIDDSNNYDIYVLCNNELIASIKIEDKIKDKASDVLEELQKLKYNTVLISGDKKEKCDLISNKLFFNQIFSEQLPKNKIDVINNLKKKNPTAMIGDGINDAPALTESDVGISIANANGIAIQSSDVILLSSSNLDQLIQLFKISKATFLTIKQNLFWAFSYNIIAIPLAFMGLLNPMWAALFMAFSDIVVIGNSIRLRYKKIF